MEKLGNVKQQNLNILQLAGSKIKISTWTTASVHYTHIDEPLNIALQCVHVCDTDH